MKRWPTKPLGELIAIEKGKKAPESFATPKRTSLRYLQIEDLRADANVKYCEPFSCPKATKSDVIIAWDGANAGTVSCNLEGHIGSTLAILRPIAANALSAPFLSRYLEGNFDYLQKTATGATIPHISKSALSALQLPVPPLEEQERIVKLLDEADELRKLRAQADCRAAALIPALFHEMFGDPVTNPKGWPSKRLGETTIVNPKLPKEKQPSPEAEVSFVPMAAVNETRGVISSSETRPYKEVAKGYTPFQNGDVLFAKITPCMQNGKSAVASNLIGGLGFGSTEFHVLRPTDVVTSEYIFWLIRRLSFRAQAEQNFTGTAGQQRVPTSFMENYPCPVPPSTLQKKFTSRVSEIRGLEVEQAASHRRLDDLFQSVLHRAFIGEL